jgi:hypothetical protein
MTLNRQILKMSQMLNCSFAHRLSMMLSIPIRKNSNFLSVLQMTHILIFPLFFDHIDEVCQGNTLNLNVKLPVVFGLAVEIKPRVLIGKLLDNLLKLRQLFYVPFLKANHAKFVPIVWIDSDSKSSVINKIYAVF